MFELIKQQSLHSSRRLTRILIVSGVFFLSSIIGLFFQTNYLILPFLLTVAFGGFIILARYPAFGPLVLIIVGLLVNFEIGTGTKTRINLVIILLPIFIGIWLIDMLVRKGKVHFTPSRTNPPIIAMAVVSLLAFGIGQLTWFLYSKHAPILSQIGGLAIFLLSFGAFIYVTNVIKNIKWLRRLTWLFIIVGSIIILSRIIPVIGPPVRKILPSGITGSLFWIWIIAIAYSQLIRNRDLTVPMKLLLAGLIVITLYEALILAYNWKSGWIPALAAIGIITWIRFPKIRIPLVIGGAIVAWLMSAELIQSDQYSYVTRIEAWKIMMNEIVNVNPLLGLGPANYRFYTPLFPIMGYYVEFNSHNNYIDILAQIGVLGLLFFLWFAWEIFRTGWGLLGKKLDNFSQAYVIGALGGLVGMLVAGMLGDWVLPFVYNVGLRGFRTSVLGWIFLGGLVVIEHLVANEKMNALKDTDNPG
jgi:hypothetical protein